MQFLYFAYGSNLLTQRLRARTASAIVMGWGILPDHALRWHMASTDGSGKCDVVEDAQVRDPVHGVVYRIDSAEKPLLDQAESLGVGYRDEQVTVHMGSEPVRVWLYKALQVDADAVPYDWYHALVLGGAREHGLPADYLRALEAVRTRVDPDLQRAAQHFALTRSAG
jgi:gamma-glutamylcyclotransferase